MNTAMVYPGWNKLTHDESFNMHAGNHAETAILHIGHESPCINRYVLLKLKMLAFHMLTSSSARPVAAKVNSHHTIISMRVVAAMKTYSPLATNWPPCELQYN